MKEIKKVTVIGANGAVGSGVSGIFASFGGAIVYVVARSNEKAEIAKKKATMSVKAASIEARMMLDLYKQVTNKAGDYQIKNVKNAMMLNLGGTATTNYCFIIGKK